MTQQVVTPPLDLTKDAQGNPLEPVMQGADVLVCTLGNLTGITANDKVEADVRKEFGRNVLGRLTREAGNFVLDPQAETMQVWFKADQSRNWEFGTVTEEDREQVMTFTILHENAASVSYIWSGQFTLYVPLYLGTTRRLEDE